MTRRRHEPVQATNPFGLTVKQHVFPKRSIARFTGPDQRVTVVDRERQVVRSAKPDDPLFCARRVWDHGAETGYMLGIEDRFQTLADRVIAQPHAPFSADEERAARRFLGLWWWRARLRDAPDDDISLQGVEPERALSKHEQEEAERHNILFFRESGVPARLMYGMHIHLQLNHFDNAFSSCRWGVLHASEGEWLVPDMPELGLVPLTPALCLYCGPDNTPSSVTLDRTVVERLNRSAAEQSRGYWLCRTVAETGVAIDGYSGIGDR